MEHHRWVPVGLHGGRPKKGVTLALVNDLAAEASPGAMAQLVAISQIDLGERPELANVARAACNDVLDRGIGKVVQAESLAAFSSPDLKAELSDLQRLFQELNQKFHPKAFRFLRSNSRPSRVVREKHTAPPSLDRAIHRAHLVLVFARVLLRLL